MDEVARVGEGLVDLAPDYAEMLEVGEATNNTRLSVYRAVFNLKAP